MPPKGMRVRDLAARANVDVEEALLTLWDSGLDEFDGPEDFIPRRRVLAAMRALGLRGEELTVDFWLRKSGLSRNALAAILAEHGIRLGAEARRIPKNSLRRLRRLFNARVIIREEAPTREPLPPLRWETIGQERDCRMLSEDEVRAIHRALEVDFAQSEDPILPPGVRDSVLLSSALLRPHTHLSGHLKYPTVELAAAALFHSLIHNHPFFNGNKRTALVSLLAFLDENGLVPKCSEQELFRFTLRTAQHRLVPEHADERSDREVQEIARWIKANSRVVERGERPMKWIALKQRLREFGCRWEPAGGRGNRLNVAREVPRPRRLGIARRPETLTTQVAWAGDGTEADRSAVHKLRHDLHLDDDHDVDSAIFYAGAEIDAFIIDYRRILKRLAKL